MLKDKIELRCFGHVGVLVDAPKEGEKARPYWVTYKPSDILGWRTEIINGARELTQVRLLEKVVEPDGAYGELSQDVLEDIYDIYSIPDITYTYLNVGYRASDSMQLSLSVSNLFDKQPPYYKDFFGFVDPQIQTPQNTYDIVGRYFQLGFKLSL